MFSWFKPDLILVKYRVQVGEQKDTYIITLNVPLTENDVDTQIDLNKQTLFDAYQRGSIHDDEYYGFHIDEDPDDDN
jgi:hypothetical protein